MESGTYWTTDGMANEPDSGEGNGSVSFPRGENEYPEDGGLNPDTFVA